MRNGVPAGVAAETEPLNGLVAHPLQSLGLGWRQRGSAPCADCGLAVLGGEVRAGGPGQSALPQAPLRLSHGLYSMCCRCMHACMYLSGVSIQAHPHQARAAATRLLLLDTTIDCLSELGYAGTTGPAVAERAGLSRGAQLHHFGTRDQMVIAAVEHLAQRRLARVNDDLMRRIGAGSEASSGASDSVALTALELLAEATSGPLYGATLELWAAARTDVDLRGQLVPAEERVHAGLREVCRSWITADPLLIQMTLDLLLGRGVSGMLVAHPSKWQRDVLQRWIHMIRSTDVCAALTGAAHQPLGSAAPGTQEP